MKLFNQWMIFGKSTFKLKTKSNTYLFDTHSLIFWATKKFVSKKFLDFFDDQVNQRNVFVSSISFWETALLSKKNKIDISDVNDWKSELLTNTNIRLIDPTATEMIESTLLADIHKDPFDRLLIVQANNLRAYLVTKDKLINEYAVKTFWL
ncbi:twitching motility protein PilT [Candidatus Magnetomorum sp. HK-1]|nr:twitching motility protein PilT [Candidatus Magnetomorum sp. HK-1]